MIVRYEPSYKDALLKLCRQFHAESRYAGGFDVSEKKLLNLFANPSAFCALSVTGDEICGFFFGVAQPMWFSEKKYGFDLALYVAAEHRGGMHAVRLIKAFENFCRAQGCVEIMLSSSANVSTELAERLYKKLGYRNCGFISNKSLGQEG